MRLAGLDVGFSKKRKSTAIAVLIDDVQILKRVSGVDHAGDELASYAPFDCIAVDGPIPSSSFGTSEKRSVESLFQRGAFQRRCKPGASHVCGTGQTFREVSRRSARRLVHYVSATGKDELGAPDRRVVEAFPNAFLGVLVSDDEYRGMPTLRPRRKFDWLYERCIASRYIEALAALTQADARRLIPTLNSTTNHDERAALVCLMTALLVTCGHFTAVGDPVGGWFFLPPLAAWQRWAVDDVRGQARRLRAEGEKIEIWDGSQRLTV